LVNTVHVTVAAAIVAVNGDPAYAWPLAIGSHIALDTIPHWNWHPAGGRAQVIASSADIILAVGVSVWLAFMAEHFWITLIACGLAMVPDLVQGPYYLWNWRPQWLEQFVAWESRRQKWPWLRPWMGVATQMVVLLLAIFIFLMLRPPVEAVFH
jgi:hypothetical protein